jgi:hypothetical protein
MMRGAPQAAVLPATTVLVAAAITLLYARSALVLPFGDDWLHIVRAHLHGFNIFFAEQFFRPFERLANAINYRFFDIDGYFTLACNIVVLLSTGYAVYRLTRRLVPQDPIAPLLAASFFLVHPGNVASVIQIDTLSQCLAGLFAVLAVRFVVYEPSLGMQRTAAIRGFFLVLAALMAKETSVGSMLALPLAVLIQRRQLDCPTWRRDFSMAAFIVTSALLIYLLTRAGLGAAMSGEETGRYAFTLRPFRIAVNTGLLSVGSLYFGDSARLLAWGHQYTEGRLEMAASALVLGLAMLGVAGRRPGQSTLRIADFMPLTLVWIAGAFPAMLLRRVSEQYWPGLIPFACIGLACGLSLLIARFSARPGMRSWIAASVVLLLAVWCMRLVDSKQRLHADLSDRTWAFSKSLADTAGECPAPNEHIFVNGNLLATNTGGRAYSVFSARNADVLEGAFQVMRQRSDVAALFRQQALEFRGSRLASPGSRNARCTIERLSAEDCLYRCVAGAPDPGTVQTCRLLTEGCADPF